MDRGHRAPLLSRAPRGAGFTLLEVLVALAVLATTLTALVLAGTQRSDSVAYLRDRTIATWIASDRLTELRLARTWPETGTRAGTVEATGRSWRWQAEIRNTPDESVRRVELTVRLERTDERLARVVGYVGDPDVRAGRQGPS